MYPFFPKNLDDIDILIVRPLSSPPSESEDLSPPGSDSQGEAPAPAPSKSTAEDPTPAHPFVGKYFKVVNQNNPHHGEVGKCVEASVPSFPWGSASMELTLEMFDGSFVGQCLAGLQRADAPVANPDGEKLLVLRDRIRAARKEVEDACRAAGDRTRERLAPNPEAHWNERTRVGLFRAVTGEDFYRLPRIARRDDGDVHYSLLQGGWVIINSYAGEALGVLAHVKEDA